MTRAALPVLAAAALAGCTYDFDRFEPIASGPAADASADARLDAGADAAADDASGADAQDGEASAPCDEAGAVVDPASGHCYFVGPGTSRSWSDAVAQCAGLGAHLATVTSAAEQKLVAPFAAQAARWIGLSSDASGAFSWLDGSPLGYTSWSSGQPSPVASRCVELHAQTGLWSTLACTDLAAALCEREP